MTRLPANLDLSFLPGLTLTTVTVSRFAVALNFEEVAELRIESCVQLRSSVGHVETVCETDAIALAVVEAVGLGATVVKAIVGRAQDSLELAMSSGYSLILLRDADGFDSYSMRHGPFMFVV